MPLYNPEKHGAVEIPPLLPEQERDAKFLADFQYAGDFSEPGAGKTLTALQGVKLAWGQGVSLLIIAPPISLRMWTRTAAAFFKPRSVFMLNSSKASELKGAFAGDMVVTTYAIATKCKKQIIAWSPKAIIIDEAHMLKSAGAARTKAIYNEIVTSHNVRSVFALTGTPILRHNDDLYPMLKALAPDLLTEDGTLDQKQFLAMYTKQQLIKFHQKQWKPTQQTVASRNTERLNALVYGGHPAGTVPFACRRMVDDLVAMPPVTFEDVEVHYELSDDAVKLSASIADFALDTPALATVRRELGVAKVPAIVDVCLERKRKGEGMLVLFWHRDVGDALYEQLRPHGTTGLINGSSSAQAKGAAEDAFNAGKLDYLVIQMAAAGVSLNLQKGGTVAIFAELDWSPGVIEQAYKRLWRMGQSKHVQVIFCVADHEADAAAYRVAVSKTKNIETLQG